MSTVATTSVQPWAFPSCVCHVGDHPSCEYCQELTDSFFQGAFGHDNLSSVLTFCEVALPIEREGVKCAYKDMLDRVVLENALGVFSTNVRGKFLYTDCAAWLMGNTFATDDFGELTSRFSLSREIFGDSFHDVIIKRASVFETIDVVQVIYPDMALVELIGMVLRANWRVAYLRTLNPWQLINSAPLRVLAQNATQTVATLCKSRALLISLKAELFRRILTGRIVRAETDFVDRQLSLFEFVSECMLWCLRTTVGLILLLSDSVASIRSYPVAYAAVEFVAMFAMTLVFAVCFSRLRTRYTIKKVSVKGPNRFLAKRMTPSGDIYECVYEGKLVLFESDATQSGSRVEEMALPGSEFYPSSRRSVGAVLVATESTELTVVGCFWRLGDFLITAKHVANLVTSGVADVYLATTKETSKGLFRVNTDKLFRVSAEHLDIETNQFDKEFDVYAKKMTAKEWAAIGLSVSSVKTKSAYNQTVSAVGFKDGLLMTSAGKTLKDSGAVDLFHTASTTKGFSGSPLYSGGSVVGMHVAAEAGRNVAIRVELIQHALARHNESNPSEASGEQGPDWKFEGRSADRVEYDDDEYAVITKSGKVHFGFSRSDLYHSDDEDDDREAEEDRMDADAAKFSTSRSRRKPEVALRNHSYVDENASLEDSKLMPGGVIRLAPEKPVHCNTSPKEQAVISSLLDDGAEELAALGYDATKYVWPEISPLVERVSLVKHLELYTTRCESIEQPPTREELIRAQGLVATMMVHNRYDAPSGYRSQANLVRILQSSLVKDGKSPGQPYQSDGLVTNGAVLKNFTVSGFAEIVDREWNEEFDIKVFIKAEPTKAAKVIAGMPRVIAAMPLHKMVKNQAVFEQFRNAITDNWRSSPVKYCFSPLVPGHIRHVASVFKGREVHASDKRSWDFNCFKYVFDSVAAVVVLLACRPDGMSEADFEAYATDVHSCFNEVSKDAKYRCSSGERFKSVYDGIMKSGWFMTIDCNSIAQVLVDVLVKIREGLTNEQILSSDFAIVAGGDDVLQTFPEGHDTAAYLVEAKKLGFLLTDFEVTKTFHGCEFFSTRFYFRNGAWEFLPERFTKHIAKLRTVKLENLAGAISSHMLNHAWSAKHFNFFERLYMKLRKEHPAHFPLSLVQRRQQVQYKLLGLECEDG